MIITIGDTFRVDMRHIVAWRYETLIIPGQEKQWVITFFTTGEKFVNTFASKDHYEEIVKKLEHYEEFVAKQPLMNALSRY